MPPKTTLFMLMSVDGKISTGGSDARDFDKDLPVIKGVKEGLKQYYELEKKTDVHSFNTGRVMAKIGVNTKKMPTKKVSCAFVIADNMHLTKRGIEYLARWTRKLYLVTSNKHHPAFEMKDTENLVILYYPTLNFKNAFHVLKETYGIKRITVQSGGTMNAILLRQGLIDEISLIIVPALIGGTATPTLIDGESLFSMADLKKIRALKLKKCTLLQYSYIHLQFSVCNV